MLGSAMPRVTTSSITTRRNRTWIVWIGLAALSYGSPALAQSQQAESRPAVASSAFPQAGGQAANQQLPGVISGRIVDRTGMAVAAAKVSLTREDRSVDADALSNEDGQFTFANIPGGSFELTITSSGFATQSFSGNLRSGETYVVPQIVLVIATAVTELRVIPSQTEIAEDQIKEQEKQRALGFIPNFYVSYVSNAAPLRPKQKFELAWKTMVDPVTFGLTGVIAGVQQAQNDFSGYGQGAEGYAKRYGAAYVGSATGTFIGSAILPSLLKQDPRYFYKGTGSKRSRALYAVANSVICKGDNGRWQPSYSSILGSFAAGAISILYYPAEDRNAARLTWENALIGVGANAATNLLQEFVIRKLTPNVLSHGPGKSQNFITKLSTTLIHTVDLGD
jgi:hypothetical protein